MPRLVYNSPAEQAVLEAARQPYAPEDVYICTGSECIPVLVTHEEMRTYVKKRDSGPLGVEDVGLSEKLKYRSNAVAAIKKGERVTI